MLLPHCLSTKWFYIRRKEATKLVLRSMLNMMIKTPDLHDSNTNNKHIVKLKICELI